MQYPIDPMNIEALCKFIDIVLAKIMHVRAIMSFEAQINLCKSSC